ncbi:MAG: type II and III secretion system protein family protein, partial [Bradyrhizobium sp.]
RLSISRVLFAVGAVLALCLVSGSSRAFDIIPTQGQPVIVTVNEGTLLRLDTSPKSIVIANPDIADVSIRSPRLMYIFGKKTGETTLYATDAQEHVLFNITVRVIHDLGRLKQALAEVVPGGQIAVESVDGGIIMQGTVATGAEAEDARRIASKFLDKGEELINRLSVTAPNQVNLRVRIAEVDRTVVRQLGIDWNAAGNIGSIAVGVLTTGFPVLPLVAGTQTTGVYNTHLTTSNWDVNSFIDALATEGLVTLLAEPNLTALSGETASFLAGGQFPVPVPQASNGGSVITIEFKNFGVGLSFTPTLLAGNRISMRVQPEVSELDFTNKVIIDNQVVPGLTVRRANTTVELASGQSFAIAGLIQNSGQVNNSSLPGLGDIPIIGELFRSNKFQRSETELVIIVTPYIVSPVNGRLAVPTDAVTQPQAGAAPPPAGAVPPQQSQTGGLAGQAGFGIE